MKSVILALASLALAGCSSRDDRLYDPGPPPRLVDGTIRMTTQWTPGDDRSEDLRIIRVQDGKVTCSFISPGNGHFVGEAPEEEWTRLWSRLFETDPFDNDRLTVEPAVPQGGPYHVVNLQLGGRVSSFSAQFRANLLGVFTSQDIARRIDYTNLIVDFVSRNATRRLEAPPAGDAGAGTGREGDGKQ